MENIGHVKKALNNTTPHYPTRVAIHNTQNGLMLGFVEDNDGKIEDAVTIHVCKEEIEFLFDEFSQYLDKTQ